MKQNVEYFPGLTGIRAIAAFMVFIHHYNPFLESNSYLKLRSIFGEFHVGVSLFFVLSGFLIGYRYYAIPKLNFKQYMLKKFLFNF